MSDSSPSPTGPGLSIPDADSMWVSHIGGHEYRVLSNGDARPTAYVVDIEAMTCTCPDHKYRRDGNPEVCKHVAKVLLVAPSQLSIEEHATNTLLEVLSRLHTDSVSGAMVSEGATDGEVREAVEEAESEPSGDDGGDGQTTAQAGATTVCVWLETAVPAMEHVDVRAGSHDGRPGVVIEPDNRSMSDSQWDATKGVIASPEWTEPHVGFGDDPCNICGESDGAYWYFINNDDLGEVPS